MRSEAGKKLTQRIKDIDQLIAAHRVVGGPRRGRRRKLEALNRSAVVLACAHLEGFMEELFSEALDALLAARPPAASVPDAVKVIALRRLAQPIRDSRDWRKHDKALGKILAQATRYGHPRTKMRATDINRDEFLAGFDNPWAKDINDLFANLGIVDVLSGVSWRRCPARKVTSRINELVGTRNSIAHGDLDTKPGLGAVERHRLLLRNLGARMEAIVASHIANITGRAPW